ncbi:uncharacterized protein [Coffea arabica]|uniref:C3H1-type domain-containing protein n=1 Tax=Coffea arabica TaxID=13443 RepID=A0A6P6WGM8_COFAR|nr:mRNA decay activator protein ZFP36L2-like [Coffea arabica]XP_027112912.1 mRNA decay activator protein ZFP36L2-like [Coffea arabica]
MENLYGGAGNSSSTRTPKLNSINGNVSPLNLNTPNFNGRGSYQHHHLRQSKSPVFDPYASSDSGSASPNLDSPLIRYLRSSSSSSGGKLLSPLASIENFDTPASRSSPVFKTPLNIEEDVLVMDGILVDSSNIKTPKGGGVARMRSPLAPLDSDGRQPSSLSSSLSSGGSENSFYKTEKCRSSEDSNAGRFGTKCQFAHGKEELRSSRISKNKLEAQFCKTYSSGSCAYGTKCRFVHDQIKAAVPSMEPSPTSKVLPTPRRAISPITLQNKADFGEKNAFTAFSTDDWSALDDGIGVTLPSGSSEKTPSKEDVNAHIQAALYGPSPRKRLPVFTEFCPD